MVKHNQQLVNPHFHKKWDKKMMRSTVKTWFDQPAKQLARRKARVLKAKAVAPRPVGGDLRPVVRAMSQKYNSRLRFGRGFTLDELKKAGLTPQYARTVGIAVDFRRRNASAEALQLNVQRLKLYKSKLVVFPRKAGKPKQGDASAEVLKTVADPKNRSKGFPLKRVNPKDKARVIDPKQKTESVFTTLRKARGAAAKIGWPAVTARYVEAGSEPPVAKAMTRIGAKRATIQLKKTKK